MGTSTPFGGGKNNDPLLPSWLNTDAGGSGSPPTPSANPDAQMVPPSTTPPALPAVPPPNPNRYLGGRRMWNSAVKASGDDERSRGFAKAARSYVNKSSGGAGGATARATSDRRAATRLASFLLGAGAEGSDLRQELKRLNLGSIASRSTEEIFYALVDYICEPGGDLDESYARNAYIDAMCEIPEDMKDRLERPDKEVISFIIQRFIANAVMKRIKNAIGNDIITLPENGMSAREIQKLFQDWVTGRVKDSMAGVGDILRQDQVSTQIDTIFRDAYSILGSYDEKDHEQ